jgi:hypothetical protein
VLLAETLPDFALELEQLLAIAGKPELAAQIPGLVILDRCRCEDDFCSSFYTQPKPEGHYGPGHNCMDLDAGEGMVLLDVVAGKIAYVEVLNCDDVRRNLMAKFR